MARHGLNRGLYRLVRVVLCLVVLMGQPASAVRRIGTNGLATCMKNSALTAKTFDVYYYPDNSSVVFDIQAESTISGSVTVDLEVSAYGKQIINITRDSCSFGISQLCNLQTGDIEAQSFLKVSKSVSKDIPSIAYTFPDLDGLVVVRIKNSSGDLVACVQASLSNSKTVLSLAVSWVTAVISLLAFVAGGIASAQGNANSAGHVASHALALFSFFQTQAIYGMSSVKLPPIVRSWTQNFQWSMGIIKLTFMQNVLQWYVNSTGGSPSLLWEERADRSVVQEKRRFASRALRYLGKRAFGTMNDVSWVADEPTLHKRASEVSVATYSDSVTVLRGIDRVGFRAGIESTNIYMTGYAWCVILLALVAIVVLLFKGISELLVRRRVIQGFRFLDFRNGWKNVLKGVLYRFLFISYPQITLLAMWELTQRDSPAVVLLAILMLLIATILLGWACVKVVFAAQRSIKLHGNAAYLLFSDPKTINRWGFLYIQYQAQKYWFVLLTILFILVKSMVIGLSQSTPSAQAITLMIVDCSYFLLVCIFRPFMDRRTNAFMIFIAVANVISVICILIFSSVVQLPAIASGVLGVAFFVINAIVALILLIVVIVSASVAVIAKNPDVRYKRMKDNRASFIKSSKLGDGDGMGPTEMENIANVEPKQAIRRDIIDDDDDHINGAGDDITRFTYKDRDTPLPATPFDPEMFAQHGNHSNSISRDDSGYVMGDSNSSGSFTNLHTRHQSTTSYQPLNAAADEGSPVTPIAAPFARNDSYTSSLDDDRGGDTRFVSAASLPAAHRGDSTPSFNATPHVQSNSSAPRYYDEAYRNRAMPELPASPRGPRGPRNLAGNGGASSDPWRTGFGYNH